MLDAKIWKNPKYLQRGTPMPSGTPENKITLKKKIHLDGSHQRRSVNL